MIEGYEGRIGGHDEVRGGGARVSDLGQGEGKLAIRCFLDIAIKFGVHSDGFAPRAAGCNSGGLQL